MKALQTLTTTLVFAACVGLAACSSSADGNPKASGSVKATPVKVMLFPKLAYRLPFEAAIKEGYFADAGLAVESVDQPTSLTGAQGLQATGANVGVLSTITVAQARDVGIDQKLFCGAMRHAQSSIMAKANGDYPAVGDGVEWQELAKSLSNKKIGFFAPVGSGTQKVLAASLADAGVKNPTYVTVGTSPAAVTAALANGGVDVAITDPPLTQMLQSSGQAKELAYLTDALPAYAANYNAGWGAPSKWLESNPDVAKRFCDAIKRGSTFINDAGHSDETARLLVNVTGVKEDVADRIVKSGTLREFTADLPADIIKDSLQRYVDLGILKPPGIPTDELRWSPKGS